MALPVLTAKHAGDGVWDFECPLHDDPWKSRNISSPRHARIVLEGHLDREHPGTKVRIKTESDYSGTKVTQYTSPSTVKTEGDKL